MTRIIAAVTNDLSYDQRMQRICRTLADAGYQVTLVGRRKADSIPLGTRTFRQRRLRCWFSKGPMFYAEYNIRLCLLLMTSNFEIAVACDLDTAMAVRVATRVRGRQSVFDAHELFAEVPELAGRKLVRRIWRWIGKKTVPFFDARYTVGEAIAEAHEARYGVPFAVIRNTPDLREVEAITDLDQREPVIFYQGALNAGRGLEQAIDAMASLPDYRLELAGEGDLSQMLRRRAIDRGLEHRVVFHGWVHPADLPSLAGRAMVGLNLLAAGSQSYYLSLANKFFDYLHAGSPSVNMDFPEYRRILQDDHIGLCLDFLTAESLADTLRDLLANPARLQAMISATKMARKRYQWGNEQSALLDIYQGIKAP